MSSSSLHAYDKWYIMQILYMVWNFASTDSDIHLIHSLVDIGKLGKNKLIPITCKIFWVQHGLHSNNNVTSRSAPPQGGTWPCVDEPMIIQNNQCGRSCNWNIPSTCLPLSHIYIQTCTSFNECFNLMTCWKWMKWFSSEIIISIKKLNISSNSLSLHKGRHCIWAPTGRVLITP